MYDCRMILAYHAIITTYGFWLPNDPRGSWSTYIAAWDLLLAGGKATKVSTRRSVAWTPHDAVRRRQVKESLRFPPVVFDGLQARAVARGFAAACRDSGYILYACAILPRHAHMVVARHSRKIERILGHLKSAATRQLRHEGMDPMSEAVRPDGTPASPWAERSWAVYLDSMADIARAVRYVEDNPAKEGKPRQGWSFVRAWNGAETEVGTGPDAL